MKSAEAAAALRVSQSVALVRQMPMVLFGNGFSTLFASMALAGTYSLAQRAPIVLGMWVLLVPVAISWLRLRRRPPPRQVSPGRIRKLTAYSAVLGFALAALMLAYLPSTPFEVAAVIIMGCGFMAAGAAAVLYVIPLACLLYVTPIMLAALALVIRSGSPLTVPIALLVALMACGVGWILYANWRNFLALVKVSHEKGQLLKAADDAAAAQSEFLENLSHEIRNPLSSVIGYANLLREAEARLPGELRPYVKNVVNGGESVKALLNDLLDQARLDANHIKLNPAPFPVRVFMEDAIALLSLNARASQTVMSLHIEPDVPPWQVADPFRLRQVMLNLLGNAIRFASPGRVDVLVGWVPEGLGAEGRMAIRVADTGPGVPAHERANLFERVSQLDKTGPSQQEGSGLGLSICRRLLELMGGTIALESRDGYGAVFASTLPTAACAGPELQPATSQSQAEQMARNAQPPASAEGSTARRAILVADDMAPSRELIRLMLEPLGHTVTEADSGMQALTLCHAQAFDLILMDIDMPGIDGMMATRLVRSHCPLNAATPVVAVSGHITKNHLADFRDAGIDDHLGKPFLRAALLAKVGRWAAGRPAPLPTVIG